MKKTFLWKINMGLVFAFTVGIIVLIPHHVEAKPDYSLCSGSNCTGYNPYTMQCEIVNQGNYVNVPDGYVEGRYAAASDEDCNAEWARIQNKAVSSKYAAVSQCHGGSTYNYCTENVASPGLIGYNNVVYTAMRGPKDSYNDVACGKVLSSGPISTPINYYTGSIYCTGVY